MVVYTLHNTGSLRVTLQAIEDGAISLGRLLNYVEYIYTIAMTTERQRRFVSGWGAIGQANGDWGQDLTNVVYATAWHHLLEENGPPQLQIRNVTSLNNSGNMIEMLLGLIYLYETVLPNRS